MFHILTILQCKKYKLNLYHTLNWYSQSFISGGGLSFDGMTLLCTFNFSKGMQPSRVFFFKLQTRRHFQLHKHTHTHEHKSTDSSHTNNHTVNCLIQQTVMQKPICVFSNPATHLLSDGSYTASSSHCFVT